LHACFYLTATPPIPQPHQRAACRFGQEQRVCRAGGRRVHLGGPLMRETMDRPTTTKPDLFASEVEEGAPRGPPSRHPAPAASDRTGESPGYAGEHFLTAC
jgi:hypothetical protein